METETIDRLFLELSQVTRATTRKEQALTAEVESLASALTAANTEIARLRAVLPTAEELRVVRWFSPHESTTQDEIDAMRSIFARLDAYRAHEAASVCPRCQGTGTRERPAMYDDGTMSRTLEEMDCAACNGTGTKEGGE